MSVWEICLSPLVQSSCQAQCLLCGAASWHPSIVHMQVHLTWVSSCPHLSNLPVRTQMGLNTEHSLHLAHPFWRCHRRFTEAQTETAVNSRAFLSPAEALLGLQPRGAPSALELGTLQPPAEEPHRIPASLYRVGVGIWLLWKCPSIFLRLRIRTLWGGGQGREEGRQSVLKAEP